MSGFRVRREEVPDDMLVVIRGGVMDEESLRRDARIAFLRFGEYGVPSWPSPTTTPSGRWSQARSAGISSSP